jgi:hypothetical protein
MQVIKETRIDQNCVFQVGNKTSWEAVMPVVRLAYYSNGRFSRSGSSELCIEDAYIVSVKTIAEGLFSKEQLYTMAVLAIQMGDFDPDQKKDLKRLL